MSMYDKAPYFYGTGRRKSSVARVRIYQGTGKVTINDRDIDDYFGLETLKLIVRQPLVLTETNEKFDIVCRYLDFFITEQIISCLPVNIVSQMNRPFLAVLTALPAFCKARCKFRLFIHFHQSMVDLTDNIAITV